MKKIFHFFSILLVAACLITTGCNASRTAKGAVIGSAAGGVVGGVIGAKAGNTAVGAILGAAIGGTAGALIGRYMDKQAEEIQRDLEGATVTRVGEGILITFGDKLLFEFDSAELQNKAKNELHELSQTLQKYEDTEILVEGHTDNVGTESYNLTLSEQRARAVSAGLLQNNIDPTRITTKGYGENQPVAENSTKDGRAQNRRVEIAIYANKKLQKAAKRGDLEVEDAD